MNGAAPVSTVPETKPQKKEESILELDLLGDGNQTGSKQPTSQGHTLNSGLGDLDILSLGHNPQPTPQKQASSGNQMLDLLGGGDLLSMGNTAPIVSQPINLMGHGQPQPHDPLAGFDLSQMSSPSLGQGSSFGKSTTVNDQLDLLGGISTPQTGSMGVSPIHSQPKLQENTLSLLDDDLLGGSMTKSSQKSMDFVGYEDTSLIINCKCSKVFTIHARLVMTP